MALLAETLVEEWLNRQRFFTIRGLRQGVDEIDLLAVRFTADGALEAWHVESQVSFRPIGYLAPLTAELMVQRGTKGRFVGARTDEQMKRCAAAWVEKKFLGKRKASVRAALWPGASWRFVLAHGAVKYPAELELIAACGVTLLPLASVLQDLCTPGAYTGSAGGDLAELLAFHAKR